MQRHMRLLIGDSEILHMPHCLLDLFRLIEVELRSYLIAI